jgi:hypothetical protein
VAPEWLDGAVAAIAAALPAALHLDIQPQHVCGVGLEGLSICQLEALETIHRVACQRISQLRTQLAVQQHTAEEAEAAALRAEIARLAAARKQQQQQQQDAVQP